MDQPVIMTTTLTGSGRSPLEAWNPVDHWDHIPEGLERKCRRAARHAPFIGLDAPITYVDLGTPPEERAADGKVCLGLP